MGENWFYAKNMGRAKQSLRETVLEFQKKKWFFKAFIQKVSAGYQITKDASFNT